MRKIYLTLIIIFVFFLAPGCADQGEPGPEVSNDSRQVEAELLKAYADRLSRSDGKKVDYSPENILEHVQNMEALIAEGEARGFDEIPQFQQAVHQFKAELMHKTLQPDLVPEISRDSISDEEVRTFFEENIENYSLPDLYSVTIIGAKTREELDQFLITTEEHVFSEELTGKMPETDIQTLESMPLSRYPQEWQGLLENLEAGEKTSILEHEDEFVVLRLDAVEKERFQDFEERKEYIRNDALYARYNQAWKDAYASLREDHDIRVDPAEKQKFIKEYQPENL